MTSLQLCTSIKKIVLHDMASFDDKALKLLVDNVPKTIEAIDFTGAGEITNCPSLAHLTNLKWIDFWGCKKLEVIGEWPASLEHCAGDYCRKLKVLPSFDHCPNLWLVAWRHGGYGPFSLKNNTKVQKLSIIGATNCTVADIEMPPNGIKRILAGKKPNETDTTMEGWKPI